jgi:hypothetical protein
MVLSWIVVREVGGGDIRNGFGIYSYNLGGICKYENASGGLKLKHIPFEHPAQFGRILGCVEVP